MLVVPDPTQLGQCLAQVRDLLGMTRLDAAKKMAEISGRDVKSCFSQIWTWDVGQGVPKLPALAPYMQAMGVRLAIDLGGDDEKAERSDLGPDQGREDPARGVGEPSPAGG